MQDSNSLFETLMNFSANKAASEQKKLKPSERLLQDIEGYGYDMTELKSVLTTKGHQLIVSCAGSGKTTGLIFKIIYDLKSGRATRLLEVNGNVVRVPEKIWVATFLKTGAEELASAFRRWEYKLHCADMSQAIQFSTLHAEFKRALNQMGISTEIISDKENEAILKKVVGAYAIKNANGYNLTSEDISNLSGALTYTRNRLDESRYINQVYEEFRITQAIIDSILFDWKTERQKVKKCDFEDMQEALYHECYVAKNQKIIDFLQNRYNYIYIDEFQDTSQIQYAVLKIYAAKCKQLVVIGDDDQTIYSWRGSDNSIITTKFMQDFNPVKNDLSMNFRCPSVILDAIKPSIEKNTTRFEKNLRSFNEGGIVQIGKYASYRQMALSLGDMVYEDVKKGMSVAILCRINSDGLMPAIFFDKLDKFSFSISGKGMSLDSYIGRLALSIVRLFTDRSTGYIKQALKQLTWDSYCINKLIDICKTNKCSIWTISEEDLTYSCSPIADILLEWRSMRESVGEVQTLQYVLQYYRTEIFGKESQFNDVMRSVLISLEALLDYQNYDSVEDFLIDLTDINDKLNARIKKTNAQVKVATVHEYKGKEADSVYIWNDSKNVFPYWMSMDTLPEFEEERRIHYIACTRARKVSTIMTLRNRVGQFVEEMDLAKARVLEGETSGVLGKALNSKMKETGAIKEFEKETVLSSDEDATIGLEEDLDFSDPDVLDAISARNGDPD